MRTSRADDHIRHEFRSVLNILIHFSFSLTQLVSVFAILGLQIALTATQTCVYRFGIGFWSFPFLLISPLSIWFVIWRRTSTACVIAILIQFCSTLFTTAIIIVSFLVLIGPVGFVCTTSSLNTYYIVLNGSLIGIAGLLKLFNYGEVILLYILLRKKDEMLEIFNEQSYEKDYPVWSSWSAINSETQSNSDVFFA